MNAESVSGKVAAVTGGGTFLGGYMAVDELAMWVGIIITLLSFATHLFFAIRRDRREVLTMKARLRDDKQKR